MSESPDPSSGARDQARRDLSRLHVWQFQAVRDVLLVLIVLCILWLGYAMSAITVPLLVALGLAYLFEPVISLLQKRVGMGRTAAVSTILGGFMITIVLVAVPVAAVVIGQTTSFIRNAASGRYAAGLDQAIAMLPDSVRSDVQDGKVWLEDALPWSARVFGDVPSPRATEEDEGEAAAEEESDPVAPATAGGASVVADDGRIDEGRLRSMVQAEVDRAIAERSIGMDEPPTAAGEGGPTGFGRNALGLLGSGAQRVWGLVLGVVELGLLVFLVPFYFFFFATAYPKVVDFVRDLVPHEHRDQVYHLVGSMDRAVSGFVRGRLVISAILGTVFAIGWLIVGVPYSLALGLLVGIFCAVPYLSVVGVPVAIGLLFVDQMSQPEAERYAWWGIILWPSLVYMIGQWTDDWVLTPLIQGKVTDLDPVSIVVAILAGGSLAGLYGMLLAVPVAACIKIALREIVMPAIRNWSEGRSKDPLPGN
ncbi:MAG: AI-2E family transporter [Planctomycetota bacterium]|nr:AI-2E family transporter [Planctomycetota bacterium]